MTTDWQSARLHCPPLLAWEHPESQGGLVMPVKPGDVGYDLKCWIPEEGGVRRIEPGEMANIRTGVSVKLPDGFWAEVRARSSTFAKRNLFVQSGTIDNGFTGELRVFVFNPTREDVHVLNGDRLAQLVLLPMIVGAVRYVDELPATERGVTGFGSTGSGES